MAERFEFSEGGSNKFWTIRLEGKSFTVHFGRIGTAGQMQTKEFASEAQAQVAYDKLVVEKTKKGYLRVGDSEMPADITVRPTSAGKAEAKIETAGEPIVKATQTAVAERQPAPDTPAEVKTSETMEPASATPSTKKRADAPPRSPSVRRINLLPTDTVYATFRPRTQIAKPTPRPFDLEATLSDVTQLGKLSARCDSARPFEMGPTEARFWFVFKSKFNFLRNLPELNSEAERQANNQRQQQKLADFVRAERLHEDKPADWYVRIAEGNFQNHWTYLRVYAKEQAIRIPLFSCITVENFIDIVQKVDWDVRRTLIADFHKLMHPYLTDAQVESMKDKLRSKYKFDPKQVDGADGAGFLLAAALGMHAELKPLVESYATEKKTYYQHARMPLPHDFVLGLSSPEEIDEHWHRLELVPLDEDMARGLVACIGERAGDVLAKWIIEASSNKEESQKRFPALAAIEAPETATAMVHLYHKSKVQGAAKEWLDRFPDWSAQQLIPMASGRGDLADTARNTLKDLHARGLTSALPEDVLAQIEKMCESPEDKFEVMTPESTPGWLSDAMQTVKVAKVKLPAWSDGRTLPAVVVEGRRLSPQQIELLLVALQQSDWTNVHPLIKALQENVERRAFEKMLWELFEAWQRNDAPGKEKWTLIAMGHLGGDECALRLTPYVRAWPGASQHQRAVLGLEVLRHIGTDTALMQINGIAQKLQFKALKSRAMECIEEIAKDKGLTRDQLEDRIVPDCGLDESGSFTFDFGPRHFTFLLTSDLKPMVKDSEGKVKSDLPKPSARDDAAKAAQAVADWKLLKQQIKEVAKIQAFRLEQTMIGGRRWPRQEFEELIVNHPLMVNLARMLIWGGYDNQGKVVDTFRLNDDRTYSDMNDRPATIDKFDHVGIVHPAHVSDEVKSKWGELFTDYEIVSPFQQLGRSVMSLTPEELKGREITRFDKAQLPAVTIVGALEKNQWSRGLAADAGVFSEHSKYFAGADVTAIVIYDGIGMQYIMESEAQAINSCFFVKGRSEPSYYRDAKNAGAMPLAEVDYVVVSEVLRLLTALTAKADSSA